MSKTFWIISIVLVIIASIISGVFWFWHNIPTELTNIINDATQQIFAPPPLDVGGDANDASLTATKIIAQTNTERKNNGDLPALKESAILDAAAAKKANDMFDNQYFEHVSPSGVGPAELVKNAGYDYVITGENLILGNFADEQEVLSLWMSSPGHRQNILNNRYTQIGVAIVKGEYKGRTVWIGVQEFGLPLSACDQPEASLKVKIEENKSTLTVWAQEIDQKRQEIEATNQQSPEYNALVDDYNARVLEYNSLNNDTKLLVSDYNGQINAFNRCVEGK